MMFSRSKISEALSAVGLHCRAFRVGICGDSISAQLDDLSSAFGGVAGDVAYSNYSWIAWWMALSMAEFEVKNFAVSGATSQDVLFTQVTPALKSGIDLLTLMIGVNDILAGEKTFANIVRIYELAKAAGVKMLVLSTMPTANFASSKVRIGTINKLYRDLQRLDPTWLRLGDAHAIYSNPGSVDGATYDAASGQQLSQSDGTHPAFAGAVFLGQLAADLSSGWVLPAVEPHANGDAENMLLNNRFGGSAGTIATAGYGPGHVADSWTVGQRSSANVTGEFRKIKMLPRTWAGTSPVALGDRCRSYPSSGVHYISIAAGTTGSTPPYLATGAAVTAGTSGAASPTNTTLFAVITDGSVTWMVVPANDTKHTPPPDEGQFLDIVTAGATNDSVALYQDVTTGFAVGDTITGSARLQMLDSRWQGFSLRIQALDGGGTKLREGFGLGYNSGNSLGLYPNLAIRIPFPKLVIPASTVTLRYRIVYHCCAPGIRTRSVISKAVMRNLGPAA